MAQVTMHPQVQTDEVFSGVDCFEITTSDTVNFTYQVRAVYVGGAGSVELVTPSGSVVTWVCAAGTYILCRAIRVNESGTDATGLVGLY